VAAADWRVLEDGLDLLVRPVREGMIPYSALREKSMTLEDVLIMNQYLDDELHNREVARGLREKENDR
jgi:hypothetical protein